MPSSGDSIWLSEHEGGGSRDFYEGEEIWNPHIKKITLEELGIVIPSGSSGEVSI